MKEEVNIFNNLESRSILQLNSEEALAFFLDSDQYQNFELPEYFDFNPILDFVREKVKDAPLASCVDKGCTDASPNFDIMLNKDGRYGLRIISLSNPFLYYLLARDICRSENWSALLDCLKLYASHDKIKAISIPLCPVKNEKFFKATTINNWWNNFEQKAVSLALDYQYMFVTDITNCYGSMMIPSIEWALSLKGTQYETKGNEALSKQMSECLQLLRKGQDIGIPQGSTLYDFIAELILGYSDVLLKEALEREGIDDGYTILRYRDDYKVFANDRDLLERISYILQHVLNRLNLRLNTQKTKISESIITDTIKADKQGYILNTPIFNKKGCDFDGIQKHLLYILLFSRKYPNSGQLRTLLSDLDKRIEEKLSIQKYTTTSINIETGEEREEIVEEPGDIVENIFAITSIVVQIAIENIAFAHYPLKVISRILSANAARDIREEIIEKIVLKLSQLPNTEYLKIWLQDLALTGNYKGKIVWESNKLCQLVDKQHVTLWDNRIIHSQYTDGFDASCIIDCNILNKEHKIINFKIRGAYNSYTE